ncbi:MAG: metallophosphoesterase [Alphaproteobacteria bacterium]
MTGPFTIAHFTDPHLPLLADEVRLFAAGLNKRLSGVLSWRLKRRRIHLPEILAALVSDIHAHRPDHIVLTGDLLNISLPEEFTRAKAWLGELGAPTDVSLVPGNHDAYMAADCDAGQSQWAAYMQGDDLNAGIHFPYCRVRGGIAFIGVSTAVPTQLFDATGAVGAGQRDELGKLLERLGQEQMLRIVMMHHPPGPSGASKRKGLTDLIPLRQVFARHGAELVLHGHTHRGVFEHIAGPHGSIPVLAPSSASALDPHRENARWHLLEVSRAASGNWQAQITVRGYIPASRQFGTEGQFSLLL